MSILSFLESLNARARIALADGHEFVWLNHEEATRLLELGSEVHLGRAKGMRPEPLINYIDHVISRRTKGVLKVLQQ